MIKDLLQSANKPKEVVAMMKMKFGGYCNVSYKEPLEELAVKAGDKEFCYAALHKVSRSFAVVIQHLPEELRDSVCVFYLVLRGLDSVEDDMEFPNEQKWPLLRDFHKTALTNNWNIVNVGDSADYRTLLKHFDKVSRFYNDLKPGYREVIADITCRMGEGMADFAEKKVNTLADYDLYCHYVAGLVGIGLSGLFSASGLENKNLKEQRVIANSMGLMLQKTNIIRDYWEDLHLNRAFWPKDIWSKYYDDFTEFEKNPTSEKSLACLNELVTDALRHVPDCLNYMRMLNDPQIFRFCAIPQVMAMATMAKIYNNPNVFTSVVKIRKGLAAKQMIYTNDIKDVCEAFETFAYQIMDKLNPNDPNYLLTKKRLHRIIEAVDEQTINISMVPTEEVPLEESVLF